MAGSRHRLLDAHGRAALQTAALPLTPSPCCTGTPCTPPLCSRSAPPGGPPSGRSSAELSDLRREVEVMRALSHPNLLRLFEVIQDKEGGKVG